MERTLAVPILLAWALVLSEFSSLAVPVSYLVRPLLVVSAMAIALGAAGYLALHRRSPSAAVVAATTTCAILMRPGVFLVPLLGIGAVIGALHQWRRIREKPGLPLSWDGLARVATVGTMALLSITTVAAVSVAQWPPSTVAHGTASTTSDDTPNFYLVLLDGYPRADTLRRAFGFDNAPFLSELRQSGFDVYREATSDHTDTSRTLAAIFGHGSPDGIKGDAVGSLRQWRRLIAQPLAVEPFRQAGYEFITIVQPVGQSAMDGADRVIDTGQANDFEAHLLAGSVLAYVTRDWTLDRLMDGQRQRLVQSLDRLAEVAGEHGQRLVLAHVMAPHAPFLWRDDGTPARGPACWPNCHMWSSNLDLLGVPLDEYARDVRTQVRRLNTLLLEVIDQILASDPDAAIVLFGDHGTRYDLKADPGEGHRVLFAARTPDHPGLYAADPRVATILSALAAAYLP